METIMNEKESLELITKMINTAKNEITKRYAATLLMWGYVVVIASISQFIMMRFFNNYKDCWMPWLLMIPAFIVNFIYEFKRQKQEQVKTYTGQIVGLTWLAFTISIAILLFSTKSFGWNYTPVILLLVAIAIFVTGVTYKFKPLIIGAVICWICSIVTFHIQADYQLLINAVAILFGYIIPGHMIKKSKDVQ